MILGLLIGVGSLIGIGCLTGCGGGTPTPESADKLAEFHEFYFEKQNEKLNPNALALYVDYSNCIAEGQHSRFFQAFEPSLTASAKQYFAVKGKNIDLPGGTEFFIQTQEATVLYAVPTTER